MEGSINFDSFDLPHPQDLERSARECVHIVDPNLEERDPSAFELAVGHQLALLHELESEDG